MGKGCLQRVFVIKTWWFMLLLVPENRCLITVDGSDDKFIQPEGLPNYVVAPLSRLYLSSDAPVMGNVMGNDAATGHEENEAQEADHFEGEEEDFKVVDQQEEGERSI